MALNEVLDEGLDLHPLTEQTESVKKWRQIGLGIFGLADMLIKLGIKYGSEESFEICKKIGFCMINTAILSSSIISKNSSPFESYNYEYILNSDFFQANTSQETKLHVEKYGLRNSQLLTCAPTGSIATMLGVSGGIEPIFAKSYTRKTESLHGKDVFYKIYTPIVEQYMQLYDITDEKDLPDYFISSEEIRYRERIDMQSIWQQYIDASISSTVNLPECTTNKEVEDLYLYAWDKQLKGITIFRSGCERAGILVKTSSKDESKENTLNIVDKKDGEFIDRLPRGLVERVPKDLPYRRYKIITGCGVLYFFVGVDAKEKRIFDFFTNTDGSSGCAIQTQAGSRLLSAAHRGGVDINYLIEQLDKAGTCPSFQYQRGKGKKLSSGKSCPSAMAQILKSILKEFEEDQVGENGLKIDSKHITREDRALCPECKKPEFIFSNGCNICQNCGFSKCD